MCVFLISPVPIAEPLTSALIDTPVFHNLAPRPIKYRVSVPIPTTNTHSIVQTKVLLNQHSAFVFVFKFGVKKKGSLPVKLNKTKVGYINKLFQNVTSNNL